MRTKKHNKKILCKWQPMPDYPSVEHQLIEYDYWNDFYNEFSKMIEYQIKRAGAHYTTLRKFPYFGIDAVRNTLEDARHFCFDSRRMDGKVYHDRIKNALILNGMLPA
jgi:hypothetical protein